MLKKKSVLLGLALTAAFVGCGHKKVKSDVRAVQKGVMSMWTSWLKDKNSRYDFQLNMSNDSSQSLIVTLGEMHCYKGSTEGVLKHTFFNTGERIIDFAPSQTKHFNMLCDLQEKDVKGDYRIVVSNVYANPGNDGKTKGQALAHNLELRIPAGKR